MAISSTRLTGPVYLPNGKLPPKSKIIFELTSWDREESEAVFVSGPFITELDSVGDFSIDLFTNTNGENNTSYRVSVLYESIYGEMKQEYLGFFSLSGDGPFEFSELEILSEYQTNTFDVLAECAAYAVAAVNSADQAASIALSLEEARNETSKPADTFADLDAFTTTDVPVGTTAYVKATGVTYSSVSSGEDFTTTGGVKLLVLGKVSPEAFGEIGTGADDDVALARFFDAFAAGRECYARGEYRVGSRINLVATGDMSLDAKGAKFTCVSATHLTDMLYIESDNHTVKPSDFGWWNCASLAVKGVNIRNTTTVIPATGKPDITVTGRFENARLHMSGFGTACGLWVQGSWGRVLAHDISIRNITRAAGAGVVGSIGCQAFVYTHVASTGAQADAVTVLRPNIDTVTTEDLTTDAAAEDCDGIVIFNPNATPGSTQVIDGKFRNCQGRDTKCFAPEAQIVRPDSYRDIAGKYTGSVHHALQAGDGTVTDATFTFGGAAHGRSTQLVSFYTSTARADGYGVKKVSGVSVFDQSTGSETILAVVDVSVANSLSTDYGDHIAQVDGVVINGKAVEHIARCSNFGGTTGSGRLSVRDFWGEIATSVALCDSTMGDLRGDLQNITQTGVEVPVLSRVGGAALGNLWGRWTGDASVVGVARNFGLSSGTPGWSYRHMAISASTPAFTSGMIPLYHNDLMPDGEHLTFDIGNPQGGCQLVFRYLGVQGHLVTNAADNAFTAVVPVLTGFYEVDSTGAEPTTASRFRIWKTNGGTTLNFKNASGAPRAFAVHAIV